jgi:hypothetical protein
MKSEKGVPLEANYSEYSSSYFRVTLKTPPDIGVKLSFIER